MNTQNKISIGVLVLALGVAAVLGSRTGKDDASAATTRTTGDAVPQAEGPKAGAMGGGMEDPHASPSPMQGPLPPGHPAVGAAGMGDGTQDPHGGAMGMAGNPHGGMPGAPAAATNTAGTLVWKAPASFTEMPNPSSMRLATYKVPRAGKDREDAELSVTVAGGDTTANIERWAGQFEGGSAPQKTSKTVGALKVTLVELRGTYSGGMGALAGSHPDWAMYAGIVEMGDGQSYFFKMTGPNATVQAQKATFDAMISGVKPAT
jgi:hypothetical protein